LANFTSGWGWMQSTPQWWGYQEKLILGKVTFVDVAMNVTSVTMNGKEASFVCDLTNKVSAVWPKCFPKVNFIIVYSS
jgi:hypothetical protein